MFNQSVSSPVCFQQLVVSVLKTRKEFWDTYFIYKRPDLKKKNKPTTAEMQLIYFTVKQLLYI